MGEQLSSGTSMTVCCSVTRSHIVVLHLLLQSENLSDSPRCSIIIRLFRVFAVMQDKVTVSYNVLWNAFKRISSELYGEGRCAEKDFLFHGTATKVYRLQLPGDGEGKL